MLKSLQYANEKRFLGVHFFGKYLHLVVCAKLCSKSEVPLGLVTLLLTALHQPYVVEPRGFSSYFVRDLSIFEQSLKKWNWPNKKCASFCHLCHPMKLFLTLEPTRFHIWCWLEMSKTKILATGLLTKIN